MRTGGPRGRRETQRELARRAPSSGRRRPPAQEETTRPPPGEGLAEAPRVGMNPKLDARAAASRPPKLAAWACRTPAKVRQAMRRPRHVALGWNRHCEERSDEAIQKT